MFSGKQRREGDKMDWKIDPPPVHPAPTYRHAKLPGELPRGSGGLLWATGPDRSPEYREAVALSAQAHFAEAADAERYAAAIAAEWPHFVAAVQARMADATNLPANARVVEAGNV